MKRIGTAALILALFAPGFAAAQCGAMQGMDMKGMGMQGTDMNCMDMDKKAQGVTHKAAGTVKEVDPAKGTVKLAHGPVASMNWPAMTMGFIVKDKKLFDKLAVDKKVEIEFVQQGADYVVTAVK